MEMNNLDKAWLEELMPILIDNLPNLNPSTSQFLQKVGLPKKEILYVNFYNNASDFKTEVYNGDLYLIIGKEENCLIAINIKTDELFSINFDDLEDTRFINSSIDKFIYFLGIYFKNKDIIEDDDIEEEDLVKKAKELRKIFKQADPKSLSDDDNWWATILEFWDGYDDV